MRISDWSSDVCSSDLLTAAPVFAQESPTGPTPPATVETTPRETIEGQLSQDRTVIAVPAFATPSVTTVAGLRTDSLGRQIGQEIGRPSGRERGWQYVSISVVAVSLKKKHPTNK